MKKLIVTTMAAAFLSGTALFAAENAVPEGYPLEKCPISGEKLGGHGKPYAAKAKDGTTVYLCCESCLEDFKKNEDKFVQQVKDAEKKEDKKS